MDDPATPAPRGPRTGRIEVAMLRHRRRFLAPLIERMDYLDADSPSDGEAADDDDSAPLVLALDARPGPTRAATLGTMLRRLAPGGTLAVTVAGDGDGLRDMLDAAFPRVACWVQRPVAGSIIAQARFAGARATPLADLEAAEARACTLFLCSTDALPPLVGGLYEGEPAADFSTLAAASASAPAAVPDAVNGEIALRAGAASLVDRLASLDAERLAVFLDRQSQQARNASSPWYDPPPQRAVWPLYEDGAPADGAVHPYDRRTEDDFVAVAQAGETFRSRFGLDGETPDHAGAVAALNALRPAASPDPAACVVIPVHGQLGFTLNCLHALFVLADQTAFEVVVVDDASPDATLEFLPALASVRTERLPENRGFIAACNAGAALARAPLIVLLNNDTRVLPGWLDRLCDSFRLFPRAGIVGSKLLNPDGTLQEAGAIIWRGGEAWNYGRGDDPNRPQYCYSRQVDYASGAALAIPRLLWDALGGFDVHYAPAYYEDTDLFFRARAAGYETWMQSGSRAIHYEGRTAGTDTSGGVKAYQLVNARKFRARHRAALVSHQPVGETPVLERDRARRRRALVIDVTCPTPKEDAGSLYTLMVLRVLVDLGWSPSFVPQDNFLYQPGHTDALMHMGVECIHAPYADDFDTFIERHGALFDLAVVFRASVLEQVHASLRRHAPQAAILFDVCDLAFLRLERAATLAGDVAGRVAAVAARRREIAAMAQADCILSPSSYEVGLIESELPDAAVLALPLMVDALGTQAGPAGRRDICFLGGYAHAPNVDAVAYFAAQVMPLVRAAAPGTRFIIAGANPGPDTRALACDDIVVTGFVDDLGPLMDGVRVFVCPLRYGAGMKGKILTAMAHGVPVVTTSVGIEGIAAEPGQDAIVADTPAAIAEACALLLRDDALWARLSRRGLRLVETAYSHASGKATLQRAIDLAFERWAARPLSLAGGQADASE